MKSVRRLRGFVLACLLAGIPSCAPTPGNTTEEPSMPRVLVVGGDQHHDFDRWFNRATVATLEAAGAEASYTDEPDHILSALSQIDVLYLTNNQPLPGAELRDGISRFVESGKGFIIGHAAGWYSWNDWPEYNRDLVGGGSRSHLPYGDFEVTVTDPDHAIMRGVPATFSIRDELYRFEKDPAGSPIQVLATGKDDTTGAVYPVVWTVRNGGGRIVVHTLGHDGEAHNHPAYQTIVQNSLRWVSGQVP
jgi:uncharacterized protein